MNLVKNDAAVLLKDENVKKQLMGMIDLLMLNKERRLSIGVAASHLFVKNADQLIANEIIKRTA